MSFLSKLFGGGDTPPEPEGDPTRIAEVEAVLAHLAPYVAADGGRLELRRVTEDGTVEVHLAGACATCAVSDSTLFEALEPKLRERCDWVTGVREV